MTLNFELVVERYRKSAGGTTDKNKALSDIMIPFCNEIGLVDASVELSYEELKDAGWL